MIDGARIIFLCFLGMILNSDGFLSEKKDKISKDPNGVFVFKKQRGD